MSWQKLWSSSLPSLHIKKVRDFGCILYAPVAMTHYLESVMDTDLDFLFTFFLTTLIRWIFTECFVCCYVTLFLHTIQITIHHHSRPFTEMFAESWLLLARQPAYDDNKEWPSALKIHEAFSEVVMSDHAHAITKAEQREKGKDWNHCMN